jgi:tRNA dimethylallyltransferase
MLRRFPVIVGPSAGGKSALGVAVARTLRASGRDAHVVTADSMQVYRAMDIGTAKPTPDERAGVEHHLIDLVEPTEGFTVDRWLALAEGLIERLRSEGVVPVVVGGTHLYAKALLDGLFEGPPADEALRAELASMGLAALRAELERVDPEAATRIHPNDERRTIRALEVQRLTGVTISEHQRQWDDRGRDDALLVILRWEPEALNRRINARVRAMVEAGLVEEARGLWERAELGDQAGQALGYKQLVDHFEGRCTLDEAVEKIKIETRRFAKNQRTWLRRLSATPGCLALDADARTPEELARVVVDRLDAPS